MTLDIWDKIAKIYDKHSGDEGDYCHKYIIYPEILRLLGDVSGKKILELGCGTGTLCRQIANKTQYCLGLDYSQKMLNIAISKSTNLKNIEYNLGDIRKELSIEDNSFDVVVLSMVLHTVEDEHIPSVLSEVYRVLKPGGICITALPHPAFIQEFRHLNLKDRNLYLTNQMGSFIWKNGHEIESEFYARPLNYYINLFTNSNLTLQVLSEPRIIEAGKHVREFAYERKREFPGFLVLKHVK